MTIADRPVPWFARFCWLLTAIGACLGGFTVFVGVISANGAPQEAAASALGCAMAIIPYAFARAVSEMFPR